MKSVFFFIFALNSLFFFGQSRNSGIEVDLLPKFNRSSFVSEITEFISEFGNDLYWKFLNSLILNKEEKTDIEIFKHAVHFLSDSHLNAALNLSLILSITSPKLAMFHSLYSHHIQSILGETPFYCSSFVAIVSNEIMCGIESFNRLESIPISVNSTTLFEFDHVYNYENTTMPSRDSPLLFIYSDISDQSFHQIHNKLINDLHYRYIYRPLSYSANPLHVQGYGIELAIKSMEYKLLDDTKDVKLEHHEDIVFSDQDIEGFNFSQLGARYPNQKDNLLLFQQYLLTLLASNSASLEIWQLNDLGFQACSMIVRSTDPLAFLSEISQNFPSYVASISRLRTNESLKEEIYENQKTFLSAGTNRLWFNGFEYGTDNFNIYDLYSHIITDAHTVSRLKKLNFSHDLIASLIRPREDTSLTAPLVDTNIKSVFWLNDFEHDVRYKNWPKTLQALLSPSFGTNLRFSAFNLYNGVLIIDPTTKRGLQLLDNALNLILYNAPIHFGVLFYVPTFSTKKPIKLNDIDLFDENEWIKFENMLQSDSFSEQNNKFFEDELYLKSKLIVRLINFILSLKNRIRNLSRFVASLNPDSIDSIKQSTLEIFKYLKINDPKATFQSIFYDTDNVDSLLLNNTIFIHSSGLYRKVPSIIFNGQVIDLKQGNIQFVMMGPLLKWQNKFISAVNSGTINDKSDLNSFIFSDAVGYYNDFFLSSESKYISDFPNLNYILPKRQSDDVPSDVSIILLYDFSTDTGLHLLEEALEFLEYSSEYHPRLSFLHFIPFKRNPLTDIGVYVHNAPFCLNNSDTLMLYRRIIFFKKLLLYNLEHKYAIQSLSKLLSIYNTTCMRMRIKNSLVHSLASSNNAILVVNGRIYEIPESSLRDFSFRDFALASLLETRYIASFILTELSFDPYFSTKSSHQLSDSIMYASHALNQRYSFIKKTQSEYNLFLENLRSKRKKSHDYSILRYMPIDSNNYDFEIDAVINPLSQAAQTICQLLLFFRDFFHFRITIYLNPQPDIQQFPLQRFYRFSFSNFYFDENGEFVPSLSGSYFKNLPTQHVYTMGIHTPESWLVEQSEAIADLDNIRIEVDALPPSYHIKAVFSLSNFLIFGLAQDQKDEPPSGLQLEIGTSITPHIQDTLIMENLGYFQLKASPGVWNLKIAEGRHSQIYKIDDYSSVIPLMSFNEGYHSLSVMRRPGHENEDLFDSTQKKSWFRSLFSDTTSEVINVFSLASGHLYERLLKIMMLSAIRHTNANIKFWFVEELLSPRFKRQVPFMASKYGFSVELVNYKWPEWLRRQENKMRRVWGLKILFLDVLFPLNVSKIVFVDADQVIRGDLLELIRMDLNEAPYGYVPFCNSNKAVEGFRFWKKGYWHNHLSGKPYHISALYVVDLDRFRRIRAGDTLRRIYQELSVDPNSLSNLDQDLPNYAQFVLPIFSLPQEWLWCETWCSLETLPQAKTIDLCNNPLTKEPKLDVAKRVIKEWINLDIEAGEIEASMMSESHDSVSSKKKAHHEL